MSLAPGGSAAWRSARPVTAPASTRASRRPVRRIEPWGRSPRARSTTASRRARQPPPFRRIRTSAVQRTETTAQCQLARAPRTTTVWSSSDVCSSRIVWDPNGPRLRCRPRRYPAAIQAAHGNAQIASGSTCPSTRGPMVVSRPIPPCPCSYAATIAAAMRNAETQASSVSANIAGPAHRPRRST